MRRPLGPCEPPACRTGRRDGSCERCADDASGVCDGHHVLLMEARLIRGAHQPNPPGRRGQPIRGVVASTRGSVTQPDSARRTSHFGPLEERLHARCWANQDLTGPICTGAIDGGLGSRLWTTRPAMLASGDPRPGVLAGKRQVAGARGVCGRGSISDCPRAVVSFHGHRLSEHMLLSPG